jgi:hypothetical protein
VLAEQLARAAERSGITLDTLRRGVPVEVTGDARPARPAANLVAH